MKTKENDSSVDGFIKNLENKQRKADSTKLVEIMRDVTGEKPKMWGDSIVGFGKYHYKYDSGREGDMFKVGFSPRKRSLTLYLMPRPDRYGDILTDLGKFTTSKACLYVKKLNDVNEGALRKLIQESVDYVKDKYS